MTKEQLQSYRHLLVEQKQIKAKIIELEAVLMSPKAQNLDGMPKGGSGGNDRMADVIAKHLELLDKYRDLLFRSKAEQIRIEEAIEGLKPIEKTLLRYRYLDGLKWEKICVLLNYSWRQTHRLHADALKSLEDK